MITPREYKLLRIGALNGIIETMELYAIWYNGERFIGVMQEPLKIALKPYQAELQYL